MLLIMWFKLVQLRNIPPEQYASINEITVIEEGYGRDCKEKLDCIW